MAVRLVDSHPLSDDEYVGGPHFRSLDDFAFRRHALSITHRNWAAHLQIEGLDPDALWYVQMNAAAAKRPDLGRLQRGDLGSRLQVTDIDLPNQTFKSAIRSQPSPVAIGMVISLRNTPLVFVALNPRTREAGYATSPRPRRNNRFTGRHAPLGQSVACS